MLACAIGIDTGPPVGCPDAWSTNWTRTLPRPSGMRTLSARSMASFSAASFCLLLGGGRTVAIAERGGQGEGCLLGRAAQHVEFIFLDGLAPSFPSLLSIDSPLGRTPDFRLLSHYSHSPSSTSTSTARQRTPSHASPWIAEALRPQQALPARSFDSEALIGREQLVQGQVCRQLPALRHNKSSALSASLEACHQLLALLL